MNDPRTSVEAEGAQVQDDLDDTADDLGALGFEPAVSATGADVAEPSVPAGRTASSTRTATARRVLRPRPAGAPHTALKRRLGAGVILLAALGSMGSVYAAFATSSGASATGMSAADVNAGHQLYATSCVTCHGANLEGVNGNGPALIGVGSASVYFQVSTGRMPLAQQGAYAPRKEAKYTEKETNQLGAYIEAVGGGPSLPLGSLRADSSTLGNGGELFRLNCASCHGTTGKGAPLSAGKIVPSLNPSTNKQIYTAMLSGPENMPVFNDNQITPTEKRSIIAYVQTLKASKDPGGSGVDRIGPVSEAIVIWVGGVGALMISILWIGARVR